ncbi:CatB-related O-acetyltransferase [Vibrio breoganii]|uniref:CatB-related O-acetyltransferase n=1 Tax=Vibrio breoganii TaxID=553239 RepID=A0ABX1UE82_9VIBR|nr:CatB-related O-acetyltransferase [Vibrio breoganii]NMO75056.1 CatB-related O-acetyltransferase [Vibrio breoganii]NMR71615.1 CatB-related O-acetyltransferase [Vibrio breoganii]OED99208.1 hypothetical protein A1QG_00315 [Vibrio breoganii ZF-29]OEF81001.1 hypothetical protein B003_13570 [Vibrio breoganii 1C10]PML87199.1 hypothetical protein BCT67_12545 [Vibrio breoganii]
MSSNLTSTDIKLLNFCGRYVSRRINSNKSFNPIKAITYLYLLKIRRINKEEIYTHISLNCYGFSVGKHTIGYSSLWGGKANGAKILRSIGSFSSIAPHVVIAAGNHPTNFKSTSSILYNKERGFISNNKDISEQVAKVTIGNDVWIASNVIILPGVNISDGAIVAAGSVVNIDVPPYSIVAGVPAKVKKYRFDKNTIERLLQEKWWDWNDDKIRDNIKYMYNHEDFFKHDT